RRQDLFVYTMSPASQGNLEVERYIGSCLISSSVRVTNASGVLNRGNAVGGGVRGCSLWVTRSQRRCRRKLGWAPLISMAPSNSRRNRKPSTSSNVRAIVNNGSNVKNGVDVDQGSQQSRTPLSRLAIHTQGAPLILAGRYNISGRKNNVNHNRGTPPRQVRSSDISVRRSNSVRDTRDTAGSGGSANGSNGGTPNSDCLSVASDESSGHSENSLPRIIKPRKRRKKDRKPPPQTNAPPPEIPNSTTSNELKNPPLECPSIVTLKPYIPARYEIYDNSRPPYVVETLRDDEQVSHTSEEDNHEPKLHHNFDDVEEDDDEGLHVESGTLFPYPCPPTLCQCRYCDPSGLIWDVDQHCYSPFLTPPSPTAEKNSLSYSKSPFTNTPLFLTPPPTEVRTFDFLNKDIKSSPTSSVFLSDNDHSSSMLRRSWSEPLPSTLRSGSVVSRDQDSNGNFGVIGRGKSRNEENEIRASNNRDLQNTICESTSSNVTVSTSQSLEVSTEIVTSPNGHRDIEIKFYSSSPPVGTAVISPVDTKGNCEEKNSDTARISSPCQSDKLDSQEVICVWENNDESVCAGGKKVSSLDSVDGARCDEVISNITEKMFSEQSAKKLGEGVNQLHLHAEE
ncbi:hypothetical protein L9F63_003758, partial [Diploptera punctata]